MDTERSGQTVVIFVSTRRADDADGYAAAAAAMEALAAQQPGYRGQHSVRGADGRGVTLSYWADAASARAWKAQADHTAMREAGRARWYDDYEVVVAEVTRAYAWSRA